MSAAFLDRLQLGAKHEALKRAQLALTVRQCGRAVTTIRRRSVRDSAFGATVARRQISVTRHDEPHKSEVSRLRRRTSASKWGVAVEVVEAFRFVKSFREKIKGNRLLQRRDALTTQTLRYGTRRAAIQPGMSGMMAHLDAVNQEVETFASLATMISSGKQPVIIAESDVGHTRRLSMDRPRRQRACQSTGKRSVSTSRSVSDKRNSERRGAGYPWECRSHRLPVRPSDRPFPVAPSVCD